MGSSQPRRVRFRENFRGGDCEPRLNKVHVLSQPALPPFAETVYRLAINLSPMCLSPLDANLGEPCYVAVSGREIACSPSVTVDGQSCTTWCHWNASRMPQSNGPDWLPFQHAAIHHLAAPAVQSGPAVVVGSCVCVWACGCSFPLFFSAWGAGWLAVLR